MAVSGRLRGEEFENLGLLKKHGRIIGYNKDINNNLADEMHGILTDQEEELLRAGMMNIVVATSIASMRLLLRRGR